MYDITFKMEGYVIGIKLSRLEGRSFEYIKDRESSTSFSSLFHLPHVTQTLRENINKTKQSISPSFFFLLFPLLLLLYVSL